MITERDIDIAVVEAENRAGEVMRQFLVDYLGPRAKRHPLLLGKPGQGYTRSVSEVEGYILSEVEGQGVESGRQEQTQTVSS